MFLVNSKTCQLELLELPLELLELPRSDLQLERLRLLWTSAAASSAAAPEVASRSAADSLAALPPANSKRDMSSPCVVLFYVLGLFFLLERCCDALVSIHNI